MKRVYITILFSLALSVGCTTRAPQWTNTPIKTKNSPWERVIAHLQLSEASLSNSVSVIQRLANGTGDPEISLHIAEAPNPTALFTTISEFSEMIDDLNTPRPISVELTRVTVRNALTYVSELANYHVFYKGNEAVLVPQLRNYGLIPVQVKGYCRNRNTAMGVGKFTLVCTWCPKTCCGSESLTTTHDVVTKRDGSFSLTLDVPGYANIAGSHYTVSLHPKDQHIAFIAVADEYHPKRFEIALVESNLQYHVDIELKP